MLLEPVFGKCPQSHTTIPVRKSFVTWKLYLICDPLWLSPSLITQLIHQIWHLVGYFQKSNSSSKEKRFLATVFQTLRQFSGRLFHDTCWDTELAERGKIGPAHVGPQCSQGCSPRHQGCWSCESGDLAMDGSGSQWSTLMLGRSFLPKRGHKNWEQQSWP